MPMGGLKPVFSFVWRPREVSKKIVAMAGRTGTGAIFDISAEPHTRASIMKTAGATDVKIALDFFMDPALDGFLEETKIEALWVEYHPALTTYPADIFLQRIGEIEVKCNCVPIIGDVDTLIHITQSDRHPQTVAIKGAEAAGYVSTETTGMLYAFMRQMLKKQDRKPGVIIWGGIATPEAAAAFLCSGATGIVFESIHWLTDRVQVNDDLRRRITKLRPDHTSVVGQPLGIPYRVFDKGNSLAVKELQSHTTSRLAFCRHITEVSIPALESDLGRKDLTPLGPEAAFAESFAERFGRSTDQALEAFIREIARLCQEAPQKKEHFTDSQAAKKLKTTFPIIQGAMSWISDMPGFALSVADAGGLPTVALGLKDKEQVTRDLGALKRVMGNRSYAVNIMTLAENPFRDEQLAWIEETRPPFVVIAAGDPGYAARLREQGMEVIYIAPDQGLVRMALESGVGHVVLEGNEAGGHVGEHSTLTLSQIVLDLKRREPALFHGRHIILAGGIFNQETAFRAAMLGADAVQMGTAYLATEEIVGSGALSPLYQRMILESTPGKTTVSGESIGLRVRSLKTPKIEAIRALEQDFAVDNGEETAFRRRLEAMSAGSLLMAARGIAQATGHPVSPETCLKEGQFMSGASAGGISRVCTVAELHRELAEGDFEPTFPKLTHSPATAVLPKPGPKANGNRFAITGMALVNSLGNSPLEIWNASLAMKSGISEILPTRWDHSLFYDPDPRAPGKTYCRVGAFRDIQISRKALGIPPQDFRTMSESTKLTMWLAHQAIGDSGILESNVPRQRIGVLISQNSGEVASTVKDMSIQSEIHHILRAVQNVIHITPEEELAVAEALMSGRHRIDDTTLLGRLNCTAGGFICNKYGFTGPSYSVTAACATSLAALYSAIQMIKNNIIDIAVVGGGEELLDPVHYLEFSAIGALSGQSGIERPPHESSRPFDATRDGMVMGEGGAMIIIERESIAKERGAPIHAYITGIGASNSDRGMVESLAETQQIAFHAAFEDAGYGPDQVDLVECHATSTAQGDVEEVKALKSLFPSDRRTILASFKSQIGHTLGASGLNNLIRGIFAMQTGIYPATLNFRVPDPKMGIEDWGFVIPTQPMKWPRPPDLPRRVLVNAFGFGGANYVVHLEESGDDSDVVIVSPPSAQKSVIKTSPVKEGPPDNEGICFMEAGFAGRPHRLGVLADNEMNARKKVADLVSTKQASPFSPKDLRAMARQGIFVAPSDETPPPLAFVFSGQGSQYKGMGKEIYDGFPPIRKWMDRFAAMADFDLLDTIFHSSEEAIQKTRWQQPALFTLEYAMARCLMSQGVMPLAMAGHSVGELTALCAAGVYSWEDGFRLVNKRAQCMDKAGRLSTDPGTMIAADAPMEVLERKVSECEDVFFTNFNSPQQVVLGGAAEKTLALMNELKKEGFRATRLKVSMAFHSPVMRVIRDEMEEFIADIAFHAPRVPVISNTTMEPFPDNPAAIKKIVVAHLESPVHWMQNVKTLWDDYGIRLFWEVGPRDTLCNLITDTLDQAQCAQTCMPGNEVNAFRAGKARLFSLGHLVPGSPPVSLESPLSADNTGSRAKAPDNTAVSTIVNREIRSFMLETFGKFLKPQILEAIRREAAPSFTEAHLEELLQSGMGEVLPVSVKDKIDLPISGPAEVEFPSSTQTMPQTSVRNEKPAISSEDDSLETIIRIIMDATGYERDEIEPDMDIRQDLAIRSSRLPVIMDAAEQRFGIIVSLEDFVGVRTVRDLADRISEVIAHDGVTTPAPTPVGKTPLAPAAETPESPSDKENPIEREPLKRLVFKEVPLEKTAVSRLELKPGQKVAVMRLGPDSSLASEVADLFQQEFKARPLHMDILGQGKGENGCDLRTSDGADMAARHLASIQSLAGLVLVLDHKACAAFEDIQTVPALLSGFFKPLMSLMRSPAREFCLLFHQGLTADSGALVAAEGLLGMFLAAAQEYTSVLFRSVALDNGTDIKNALDLAMDIGTDFVQILYHGQRPFTLQPVNQPILISDKPSFTIAPEDLVVISGGGRGITAHLAKALVPFEPRLVLLGRSELDPSIDYDSLLMSAAPAEEAVHGLINRRMPDLAGNNLKREVSRIQAGMEVTRTLRDLSQHGLEAVYYTCDVSDPGDVEDVFGRVIERFGRIDAIIHGAGVIRDAFMEFMTAEDFSTVMDVKFLGGWNLCRAAQDHGLRFMVGLSSIVAITGNAGQVNYCAASRALSAMISAMNEAPSPLPAKALMLPPIEGTGMADDPEIRELMKLRGMESAYVHVNELAELFCRELFLGPPDQPWVIPSRALPQVKTVKTDLIDPALENGDLSSAGVAFKASDLPMIQAIDRLDLEKGELEVRRTFSLEYDLWLEDHKPFKFLRHPLVSGIMAVEAFLETAHLLYPHMHVLGVQKVAYKDILECPPGQDREARIDCYPLETSRNRMICRLSLSSRDISPSGRSLDTWSDNYQGLVILGGQECSLIDQQDLTVSADELDTLPVEHDEIAKWYEAGTALLGRYQVIKRLDGTGPGVVKGSTVYGEDNDFAGLDGVEYQYSPYLLEALMQMVTMYVFNRDKQDGQTLIPAGIGEMYFSRRCRSGEPITLEARLKSKNTEGLTWNARATDDNGTTVMQVVNLEMKWFTA